MIHIGLTGSIGMGKSTTAAMFADAGIPVFDADAAVHRLYDKGGAAVEAIRAVFPDAIRDGAVDRQVLREKTTVDPDVFKVLNRIVHPLLAAERAAFFARAEAGGADMVVLDVPLLFESKGDAQVDAVVVATAPAHVQRRRVMERSPMGHRVFETILQQQMPDAEKRARADFVVDTSRGLDDAREQVKAIIAAMRDPQRRPASRRTTS